MHSFDGPEGFEFFANLAMNGKLGLRINYYPPARLLGDLKKSGTQWKVTPSPKSRTSWLVPGTAMSFTVGVPVVP